ncbi:hypothetical protein ACFS5N_05650 [Mucilaginibacter ximonensis]|uniref:DUF3945 domain-containing protein n=1 Tax=Mucilaginibacter ximonensis TaxID=538021 RepID=A0ABW5Y9G5_9SPHI
MEIETLNIAELRQFVQEAREYGWNWVAMDTTPVDSHRNTVLYSFESANEAEAFCEEGNMRFDFMAQDWMPGYFQFMPTHNLWAAIQNKELAVSNDAVEALAAQLQREGLQLHPAYDMGRLQPWLKQELIFQVQWNKMIYPGEEAERFHVVAHQYPGHQEYELGHVKGIVGSFDTLGEAATLFKTLTRQSIDNPDNNDYLLIAEYKDHHLKLNMEGWPEEHCGLTLQTAYYEYDADIQEKAWRVQEINTLDEPKNIRHFLYARFHLNENQLKLYDDRLQVTSTEELKITAYPSHFISEKLTIKNVMTMNMKNFEYLKDQLKYTGFGDIAEKELKTKLEGDEPKFTLTHEREFDDRKVVAQLEFNRSKESDMYFFNGYKVTTTPENQKEAMTQHFYVNHKGQNITLKEAYNLMNGRAVFKQEWSNRENQLYPAWLKLDFTNPDDKGSFKLKPYNENYGYNLEKSLEKHQEIKIVGEAAAQQLAKDLQKGNRVPITISKDGASAKIFVEASPTTHGLNVYDENMKLIHPKQNNGERQGQAEKQGQKVADDVKPTNKRRQAQHH